MVKEKNLTIKTSVDDNDFTRGVSEEGNSVTVPNSAMKTYLGEGTAVPYLEAVNIGDDKGIICTEQFSVGKPSNSKESVFGEGDSYGVGKEDTTPEGVPKVGSAWHCDISNTTGLTITGATDVTTELSSDTGSTVGLFNGTTTGKYVLVGSDYTFSGVKAKIDIAGDVEPENVIGEYLENDTTWATANFMATDANYPYTQRGNVLGALNSSSEQWRFGFNPSNLPVPWNKVTLNINGTDYTKYWARFLITSDITTDITIEQLKMHTNRFEINADGSTEYFGKSRYQKTLFAGVSNTLQNISKNPGSQNINYANGMVGDINDNKFVDNTEDGFIIPITIPEGLDTSIPMTLNITGYPTSDNAGAVKFGIDAIHVKDGFVYSTSNTPDFTSTAIDTFEAGNQNTRRTASFLIPVNTLVPGEEIIISFYRLGNDPEDTLSGSAVITNVKVDGYFWRP